MMQTKSAETGGVEWTETGGQDLARGQAEGESQVTVSAWEMLGIHVDKDNAINHQLVIRYRPSTRS